MLKRLSPEQVESDELAGEPITAVLTEAPGNGAPIGGLKVVAEHGWFAARPSGTEDVYKVYAESLDGEERLERIVGEARGDRRPRRWRADVRSVLDDGAGGRRGEAARAAHARPRQARRAVRRQLPADRLRALEPRQRRLPPDRRADAVQEPLARPPHRETWALSPLLGNYVTPVPAQMRRGPRWFAGSADAIYQNFNLLNDERPDYVIVFGADHIYRMDPRQMVDQHIESGAGVTVAALRAPLAQADQFGVIETGGGRAPDRRASARSRRDAVGLPDAPDMVYASMGNYVFSADVAARGVTRGRGGRGVQPRRRRQHHPDARRAGRGAGLRLLARTRCRARRDARARLLARRRDARRVLGGPHGPHLGRPDVQPLQPRVADPHLAGAAAAGEVRLRRRGPDGARARLDGLRGRRRLRRRGAALGALAERARPLLRDGARTRC